MPFGINAQGEVVGQYRNADGVNHGFLFTVRGFEIIDVPGIFTLRGINPRGDIVGSYRVAGQFRGFALWK